MSTLRSYGVCEDCEHPVHTDGETRNGGKGWIHTQTNQYTCPGGGGMAAALTLDIAEAKLDEAYAEGEEHGKQEGLEEGEQSGRRDMRSEVLKAIDALTAGAEEDPSYDDIYEAVEEVLA